MMPKSMIRIIYVPAFKQPMNFDIFVSRFPNFLPDNFLPCTLHSPISASLLDTAFLPSTNISADRQGAGRLKVREGGREPMRGRDQSRSQPGVRGRGLSPLWRHG